MRQLTSRQHEIVALLRQGLTQQEIARRLGLKYGTIRGQLQDARDRSGYQTTAELAAKAGLIDPPSHKNAPKRGDSWQIGD